VADQRKTRAKGHIPRKQITRTNKDALLNPTASTKKRYATQYQMVEEQLLDNLVFDFDGTSPAVSGSSLDIASQPFLYAWICYNDFASLHDAYPEEIGCRYHVLRAITPRTFAKLILSGRGILPNGRLLMKDGIPVFTNPKKWIALGTAGAAGAALAATRAALGSSNRASAIPTPHYSPVLLPQLSELDNQFTQPIARYDEADTLPAVPKLSRDVAEKVHDAAQEIISKLEPEKEALDELKTQIRDMGEPIKDRERYLKKQLRDADTNEEWTKITSALNRIKPALDALHKNLQDYNAREQRLERSVFIAKTISKYPSYNEFYQLFENFVIDHNWWQNYKHAKTSRRPRRQH
jgi:hypothetical protein